MRRWSLSRERWRLVEPLLDAALDLDGAKQRAYLDHICGNDARLRAELASLLSACVDGAKLFAEPAVFRFEPLLAEEPALPPVVGGRYHVVRELARGGMGTVYVAGDPRHGREVALKVLHARVARKVGPQRFRREIEIAARLSHPHILPLHDSGEIASDDGDVLLYYVSPLITGESLRSRMQRGPALAVEEILNLGREIAQALDYAHRQGVVHLDIKPENILLQDGHAIIADFGIAHAMFSAPETAGAEGMPVLGTPSYMSPEQRRGAHDVDGRSDIYSLGCVLNEMLGGRASGWEVVDVVVKAKSHDRGQRFQTAGELAAALRLPSRLPRRRAVRRPALVAAALVLAMSPAALVWARGRSLLDSDLIAVAPFDVTAPSLGLWREGLVDVLSRNLDGAGTLRTVPATVAIKKWAGRVDAQSAREFGQRTGARLVIFGGLLAAGDSARVTAVVMDAQTGNTIVELEQRDLSDRIDRLSDSLTVGIVRELGRSRHLDMARATSAPTGSLSALKAYLQGEQFYRAARLDSAQMHFERAIALDSSFALAYHRLAAVRRWLDPDDIPDSATFALMQRPSRYTRGLAPRERLLATIDSLYAEAHFAWRRGLRDWRKIPEEQAVVVRLVATIGDGLVRYRDDPELSFLLAEARSRFDRDVGVGEHDDRELLALYDRTIELDPTFAPAYFIPISLASYLDGSASALRYIRAYRALSPTGPKAGLLQLQESLLDPALAASLDVERLADTLSPTGVCEAANVLRHVADEGDVLLRLALAVSGKREPIPDCAAEHLIGGLLFRGHLREAQRIASMQAHWLEPVVKWRLSVYGMVPADTARAAFRRVLAAAPRAMLVQLYPGWAADGDTSAIQSYLSMLEAGARRQPRDSSSVALLRANIVAGRAYLALARRDTASALRQFLAASDTLHACWRLSRMTTVELLVATGRRREAAQRLQRRWPGTSECSDGVEDIEWTLLRARVFERLGRHADARESYEVVARAWETADPELAPRVREARIGLARLRR